MSANPALMSTDFKKKVAIAAGWSALQSWAVKFCAVLLFFVLARYLSPAEMGLAQTVTLVLAFIAVVAEQGFHRALVQRPSLRPVDVNLPFYLSVGIGVVSSALLWLFAEQGFHRALVQRPSLRPVDVNLPFYLSVGIGVVSSALLWLFFVLARYLSPAEMGLAQTVTLVLAFIAVVAEQGFHRALVLALTGHGALSVVVQAMVSVFVTALVMWRAPVWRPTLQVDTAQFRGILSYSTMAFASQLIDFFSRRLIDFIILSRHGVAALGVYTVGAKLYLTILELLSTALMEVALSAFSRMAANIERMRVAYMRLIFLASCTSLPLFTLVAVGAPEICVILFGPNWSDAVTVTQLLCVLGAIEVVQLFNIGVVGAVGQARTLLWLNVARLATGAGVLATFPHVSIDQLTAAYVISQLVTFPFSFRAAMRVVDVSALAIVRQILPGALAAALGAAAVFALREYGVWAAFDTLLRGVLYIAVYGAVYLVAIVAMCRRRLLDEWRYIESSYRK